MTWFNNVKESDRVALAILYTGILVTLISTLGYLAVVYHAVGLTEAVEDKALDGIKNFFEIGASLITGSMLALKLQPKDNGKSLPPEPPKS